MKEKKVRVLQITEGLGIGGVSQLLMNIYRNIDRDLVQFDFISYSGEKELFEDEIIELGGKVFKTNTKVGYNKIAAVLREMLLINKIIKENNYQVVHVHGCGFLYLLRGLLPAKLNNVEIIVAHGHNPGCESESFLYKLYAKIMKCLITYLSTFHFACSESVAKTKYTKKALTNSKTYKVFPNVIDVNNFKFSLENRKKIRNKLGLNNQLVIGNIGRLSIQKNQQFLIDIVNELNKQGVSSVGVIVGDGEEYQNLLKYAKKQSIIDKILFIGAVKNTNEYYSSFDLFCMPSLYEGLPLALVEAQANGLYCLVSNNVSIECSFNNSVRQIEIDKLNIWCDLAQKYNRMSETEYKKVLKQIVDKGFDAKVQSEKILQFYLRGELWEE